MEKLIRNEEGNICARMTSPNYGDFDKVLTHEQIERERYEFDEVKNQRDAVAVELESLSKKKEELIDHATELDAKISNFGTVFNIQEPIVDDAEEDGEEETDSETEVSDSEEQTEN